MATMIARHQGNRHVFDEASSYYQNLRWFKTRLTRFEHGITRKVLLEELPPSPHADALEVGCGPGTWTREVAPRVRHLTALDISSDMIDQARRYTRADNVRFVHADVARFPLTQRYDVIFSVRVVEYLEQWEPVVDRLLDALAPGGRITIITKTPLSVWRGTGRDRAIIRLARRFKRRLLGQPVADDPHFWQRYLRPADLARAYRAHGLQDIDVRPVIYGLPIFVRGTKQYPLVPAALEPLVLGVFAAAWHVADALPRPLRGLGLIFSESYAVSGVRPPTDSSSSPGTA